MLEEQNIEQQTYTAVPASPAEAETLQREWLSRAKRNKANDVLQYARIHGEKLHDTNVRQIQKDIQAVLKDLNAVVPAGKFYHFGSHHRSDADPVYLALAPFLQTTGHARRRLDKIALEYVCDEAKLRARARVEVEPRRRKLLDQAKAERTAGLARLRQSKTNQLAGTPPLNRRKTPKARIVPIPLNSLNATARNYVQSVKAWAYQQAARRTTKDRVSDPPQPPIRYDPDTLLSFCQADTRSVTQIPDHLTLISLGQRADTAIANLAQTELERARQNATETAWSTAMALAEETRQFLTAPSGHEYLMEHATSQNRYDMEVLTDLAQRMNGTPELPEALALVLQGQAGNQARRQAVQDGETKRRDDEDDYEVTQLGLTRAERIDRRNSHGYQGPPLDWDFETIQQAWMESEAPGRMPRHWYREIPGFTTPGLAQAISEEQRLQQIYQAASDRYDLVVQQKRTKGTLSTRRKHARLALADLLQAIPNTDRAFRSAGVSKPPEPPYTLVDSSTTKKNDLAGQMPLPISGVNIIEKSGSKTHRRTPPSRKPAGPKPTDFMTPFI